MGFILDMDIKTPQELNLTQEKGLAWLEKTPESPSEKPPLGWLGIRDTPWGGGTPSPADTGVDGAFPTHHHHLPNIRDPPTTQGRSQQD